MPKNVFHLLHQTLDGEAHRRRKRLFLNMMHDDAPDRLDVLFQGAWAEALPRWRAGHIAFHHEMTVLLTRVALVLHDHTDWRRRLAGDASWRVPADQDLTVPLDVLPTLPRSGLELALR